MNELVLVLEEAKAAQIALQMAATVAQMDQASLGVSDTDTQRQHNTTGERARAHASACVGGCCSTHISDK